MNTTYLELLSETFSDPSKLTVERLKGFVNETVAFFKEVKEMLASGDPVAKEEALNTSMAVKKVLEERMDGLCKLTGLDPTQLGLMSENPDNMNAEEYNLIQGAKKQLGGLIEGKRTAKKPAKLRLQG